MKTKLIFLLISCCTIYYSNAQTTVDSQGIKYEVISGTSNAQIINNPDGCPTGQITIPSTIEIGGSTYTVTSIGNDAFKSCSGLTGSLTIPNAVTSIGGYAFYDCEGFTGSLTIPNAVTSIGNIAFAGCSGFTGSLTIGNSVTTIGNQAFSGCSGLTGSLTIPNSVTIIGDYAFDGCNISTIVLTSNLTTIGFQAFKNNQLSNVTIPNNVTSMGYEAFSGNPLTDVTSIATTPPSIFTGSLDTFATDRSSLIYTFHKELQEIMLQIQVHYGQALTL